MLLPPCITARPSIPHREHGGLWTTPEQGASFHFPNETLLDLGAQGSSRTKLSSVLSKVVPGKEDVGLRWSLLIGIWGTLLGRAPVSLRRVQSLHLLAAHWRWVRTLRVGRGDQGCGPPISVAPRAPLPLLGRAVPCCLQNQPTRDFPGGPVVKTPRFHCRGRKFNPWSGN